MWVHGKGRNPAISDNGTRLASALAHIDHALSANQLRHKPSGKHIDHDFTITCFLYHLKDHYRDTADVLEWERAGKGLTKRTTRKITREVWDKKRNEKVKKIYTRSLSFMPDAYFKLRSSDGRVTQTRRFFLEIDRDTETVRESTASPSNIADKLHAYYAYKKSGDFEKEYNAKGFIVLFACPTAHRANLIRQYIIDNDIGGKGGSDQFWFGTFNPFDDERQRKPLWTTPSGQEFLDLTSTI